jgi:hypothetical protein
MGKRIAVRIENEEKYESPSVAPKSLTSYSPGTRDI